MSEPNVIKADLEFKNRYWIDYGVSSERERIIKLLDVLATQEPDYAQVLIHNLKVLIKGKNK